MNKSASRGRRPGSPDTKARIRDAARARFLADGYADVTMRAIAADAGVDVALVSYYFKSKQGLFGAAMELPVHPADLIGAVLAGTEIEDVAVTLLRTMLAVWGDATSGPPLQALAVAAIAEADFGRIVREAFSRDVIDLIASKLPAPDAAQRAAAYSTQMAGLIYARFLLRLEPIASMSPEEVVTYLAPALDMALRGSAGGTPER